MTQKENDKDLEGDIQHIHFVMLSFSTSIDEINLIVKAGQVIGALVIMEAFSPRANAQSVTSVPTSGITRLEHSNCS